LIFITVRFFKMLLRRLFSSSASSRAVDVLVVGAGPGGLAVASDINRILPKATVAIADAAQVHYYQPLWTLVGAGIKEFSESRRPMDTLIPKHAEWIQQNVAEFNPEGNSVTFENGEKVKYEYLVVATGIEVNLQGIKGIMRLLRIMCREERFRPGNGRKG
jgi:sulfide:quinone oxidoreductase